MPGITFKQVQEDPSRKDIFGIMNEYIQPESSTSASQAASSFSQSVKPQDEGFFWNFWNQIFDAAEQVPHDNPAQDKLALFIRELKLVPETGDKVWGASVWTDLPLLSAAIREHLTPPSSSGNDEEKATAIRAWVSFHAFVARLLHAGVSPGSETTGIWMLRAALEQDAEPANLDRDLMTAAVYIEYAGATLAQMLALQPEPQLDRAMQRMLKGGALWDGKSGLTAERWAFWGKRFREQADNAATSQEAKEMALHAARLIEAWGQTWLPT
ncbi:hypothetical protein HD806DRAFT_331479 [Xylariaceae sp. AK1471]|nr:hypothetical protein HD806DRAFT_331479 [Xylariaceae sp. AK1471]